MTNLASFDTAFRIYDKLKFRSTIRLALKDVLCPVPSRNGELLVFYCHRSEGRQDFNEIVENFISEIPKDVSLSISDNRLCFSSWVYHFGLFSLFFARYLKMLRTLNLRKYIHFVLEALYSFQANRILKQAQPKMVVVFCDSHPQDHVMVGIAKQQGVVTCTLQHGLFGATGDPVNDLLLLNSNAHVFLCWGRSTSELCELYLPESTPIVVGSFREAHESIPIIMGRERPPIAAVSVALNADVDFELNCSVLEALRSVKIKLKSKHPALEWRIKLHPKSKKRRYLEYFSDGYTESHSYSEDEIVLVLGSGVIVELMKRGILVLPINANIEPVRSHPCAVEIESAQILDQLNALLVMDTTHFLEKQCEIASEIIEPSNGRSQRLLNLLETFL